MVVQCAVAQSDGDVVRVRSAELDHEPLLLSVVFGLDKPDQIGAHDMYETGIDSGDDLIGRAQVAFSRIQLLGTLPNVGDVVERQLTLTGGAGDYRLNYRITRLPDVRKTVVIPRPPRQP